ncbi:MAG: hypothetical protein RL660_1520 [Bacteroidota bacterium]|jgi:predicted nucleic acid-binding protein
MRIVIDTNSVFSALLNTSGKLSRIILQPKTGLNFYTTNLLNEELNLHRQKLIKLAGYTAKDFDRAFELITKRIKIINFNLIPTKDYEKAEKVAFDVDPNDIEFVALAEHIKGKLWTGDKVLIAGLQKNKWNKIITTSEIQSKYIKK